MPTVEPCAYYPGLAARGLEEVSNDLAALDSGGRWAVAISFEGAVVCARFRSWGAQSAPGGPWSGVRGAWSTSLDQEGYESAVGAVKEHIARGWVYQVNLCRVLEAACPAGHLLGLYRGLTDMQGAFAGLLNLPDHGVHIASASPERFLSRAGDRISSSPIKGTADRPDGFLPKDRAENVMIVDLVRNDLGRVAAVGSVAVPELMRVQPYPGLFHLESTVTADVPGASWAQILSATFPPGSVSGAPKVSALQVIRAVEPVPRQWYCGVFGWIDADAGRAELGVAIRTFWLEAGRLRFGTGAGITWGSDPAGEWQETVLKAQRLIGIAESVAG